VATLAAQTRRPVQLIVVDAGDLGEVRDLISSQCRDADIEFHYVRDAPSTTRQRNKGSELVSGEIVFFLDDDVCLDLDYIQLLLAVYENDDALQVGGVTGVSDKKIELDDDFWPAFNRMFFLAETRVDVSSSMKRSNFPVHSTGLTRNRDCQLMPSTAVSYRIEVFRRHMFDRDLTGYVMAEDLDLSYRVARETRLVTVPAAVYRHAKSPVARNSRRETEKRRILFTQYFFRKNLGDSPLNWLARYWSLVGLALRYSYFALRGGNAERLQGLLDGLRAASGNKLLWPGSFKAGPLDH
jgi:GT2 family glycosyltransferase